MKQVKQQQENTSRSILITGCSSGIGLFCAEELKKRGYRVFATARKLADVERLNALGLEAHQLDLDDSDSISVAVNWVLAKTDGKLYALFNNGAYGQPGAVEDLSRSVLRQQLETNVLGWHELTCQVLPIMRKQGEGRIIQNSSVLGLITLKYRGAYSASKFAIEGLTDTLRQELQGTDIQVALIEPGPVESDFRKNAYQKFLENINVAASPHREIYEKVQQRLATTEDDSKDPFTLPPSAVMDKLIHALESKRAKERYYVTMPTYLLGYLKRILSTGWMDYVLCKISNAENK